MHLAANVATMSKEEFKEYQQEMKTERDINSIKWTAEMRGTFPSPLAAGTPNGIWPPAFPSPLAAGAPNGIWPPAFPFPLAAGALPRAT